MPRDGSILSGGDMLKIRAGFKVNGLVRRVSWLVATIALHQLPPCAVLSLSLS